MGLQANDAIFPKSSGRWHKLIVHRTLTLYIWFMYGLFHMSSSFRNHPETRLNVKFRRGLDCYLSYDIILRFCTEFGGKKRGKLLLPIHFSSVISHLAILHRTQTLHCRGLCNNIHDWSNGCFVRDGFAIFGNKISDGFVIFQSPHDDVIQ